MSGSSRSAARSASLNESVCVLHLALVDQALLVLVHELDRILDRDDVILPRPVDVVDHRAERRRLARAGRTGDEHQPLVQLAELQDVRRQPELLGGQDLRRDDAEDRAGPLRSAKTFDAEAREPGDLVGEVGVVPIGELLAVLLRHDRRQQLDDHRLRSSGATAGSSGCMRPSLRIIGARPDATDAGRTRRPRPSRGRAGRWGARRSRLGYLADFDDVVVLTIRVRSRGFDVAEDFGLPRPVAQPIAALRAIDANRCRSRARRSTAAPTRTAAWPRRSRDRAPPRSRQSPP